MISEIIAAFSAVAAAFSAIFSAVELHRSKKAQIELKDDTKKQSTIQAFNRLQDDALDGFVRCTKQDIWNILKRLDDAEYQDLYNQYRAKIAKCEHFAVGVNKGIYDFEVVDLLGGVHLIFLYDKVKPIIVHARKNAGAEMKIYTEFEKMAEHLRAIHPECKKSKEEE